MLRHVLCSWPRKRCATRRWLDRGWHAERDGQRAPSADDGGRAIAHEAPAEAKSLADDGRIFAKSGGPETICENGHAGSFGTVVLRSDEPAEDSVEAHDFEVVAADDASLNYARLAQADHGELEGRELAERAQGFDAAAQILDFGHGEVCVLVAGARGALA